MSIKYVLALLSMLEISAGAMEIGEMNVGTNEENREDYMNLRMIYEDKWNSHYEQYDIIKILGLNKDEYAESIDNIKNIGYSSVENYVNKEMKSPHCLYTPGEGVNDVLIVTNMSKDEDISAYLMRQDVSNFNYIILENLMMWILFGGSDYSVDELLDWIVNTKIKNRLASIPNKEEIEKIMSKVNKSVRVVKTYVDAGKLDVFMLSFAYLLGDEYGFATDDLDNKHEEEGEELQNSFKQNSQNSRNKVEDDTVDINTEEGKNITTKLVTSMYNLAEIYELATIVAQECNAAGDLIKQYQVEVNKNGKLIKVYYLTEKNELVKINKPDNIYQTISEKKQFLDFAPENERRLLRIIQQAKESLNEFQKKVKGGTSPRELMRTLGLVFVGEEYDSEKKYEAKSSGETEAVKKIIPINLDISRIWNLLEKFKCKITNDWNDVNVKAALLHLKPYLEKYLTQNE